jgi:DNA-binding winged helix-turn-helix (wHTH) protein
MPDQALTFGRYRLEPRRGLMSGMREVRLTPKAIALLSFLAERPGEVVTKDELFAAVWPETSVGDAGS